jgi:hypothetical protein
MKTKVPPVLREIEISSEKKRERERERTAK